MPRLQLPTGIEDTPKKWRLGVEYPCPNAAVKSPHVKVWKIAKRSLRQELYRCNSACLCGFGSVEPTAQIRGAAGRNHANQRPSQDHCLPPSVLHAQAGICGTGSGYGFVLALREVL